MQKDRGTTMVNGLSFNLGLIDREEKVSALWQTVRTR